MVTITDPAAVPVISGSNANNALYKALKDKTPIPAKYPFAALMIQAKDLLESSHSIKTVQDLTAKRKEFQEFVKKHYPQLRSSDMVRRLIGQYFMMHEYVAYHEQKEAINAKRITHQQAVLSGVGAWLELLQPLIPKQETVNYCVSLYYNRSMVTLAHRIVEHYPEDAFCAGIEQEKFTFPSDLDIIKAEGKEKISLGDFKSDD
ncbi:MAG: hypothetical protein KAI39_10660 [Desulfobulbaceae bacterium]|nr:hypothetical protein [Desulfobulbaceae bacterium]